jgi:hypothetical protein
VSHDRYPGLLSLPLRFPNRRFRVWSYVPSFSGLVLRTEFEPAALHIELLFQGVRRIDLPITMADGLMVDVEHPSTDQDTAIFRLSNDRFSGQVHSDYLFLAQEERSRYSPFSLFHGYLQSDFER